MNGVPEMVGGVEDHVHILASLRPVHCIADVLRDLKKESSTWAKDNFNRRFTWQEGYAAFTVSPTATDSVGRYIATQDAHHRKHSFVDELRELLNAAALPQKFDFVSFTHGFSRVIESAAVLGNRFKRFPL